MKQENKTVGGGRPGLPCPACSAFIPVSVPGLLANHALICPSCGLRLEMDRSGSEKALKALATLDVIQKQMDKTRQSKP